MAKINFANHPFALPHERSLDSLVVGAAHGWRSAARSLVVGAAHGWRSAAHSLVVGAAHGWRSAAHSLVVLGALNGGGVMGD